MEQKGAIGVFDSGYGGLTVLEELKAVMPEYDFIYLGDNARAPYGTRSFEVVYQYTLQAVKELFRRGCPIVILACNTASAKALRTIQQKDLALLQPDNRVLGVIRPSTEQIGAFTKTGHIGVLATEGTVKSESYAIEIAKFFPEVKVHQHACPMWVPLIENNEYSSVPGKMFIKKDVDLLLEKSPLIDTIILGCTHYPVVKDYIESILPEGVTVLSQGPIVAESLKDYLHRHPEMKKRIETGGKIEYLTSENATTFNENVLQLLGHTIEATQIHY